MSTAIESHPIIPDPRTTLKKLYITNSANFADIVDFADFANTTGIADSADMAGIADPRTFVALADIGGPHAADAASLARVELATCRRQKPTT